MATASVDSRYTFTGQFLEASALFTLRARQIEEVFPTFETIPEAKRMEHRALVSTSIMQCAAALETEAHEICFHGPGAYLGSDKMDRAALQLLKPLADIIDQQQTMRRYELILHFLRKPPLNRGVEPYQSSALLVRLRNEITHYKSLLGQEMSEDKLLAAVEAMRHKPPPFTVANMNFFPHRCLSASCSSWAVSSTVGFLDHIYSILGVPSRFDAYRDRLLC